MDKKTARQALAQLNRQMFDLVSSSPDTRSELVDFHFKHAETGYEDAISAAPGRQLLLQARDSSAVRKYLRMAIVLGDTVLFNCTEYVRGPSAALFPIPDDLASPVLFASSQRDPSTGEIGFADPYVLLTAACAGALQGVDIFDPSGFLGADWSGRSEGWRRSGFARSSKQLINHKGEECSLVAGLIHVQIPRENKLLEELRPMLESGRVAYTPFIHLPDEESGVEEACLKARAVNAEFTTHSTAAGWSEGRAYPLAALKLPYFPNVPYSMLARIVEDEQESIRNFRQVLDRATENAADCSEPREAHQVMKRFNQELEEQLEKVREECENVARMNSMISIGAVVATGALAIAALTGLTPPTVITGGAGIATLAVKEMYQKYLEKRRLRKSPMYFAWRLESPNNL